MLSFAHYPLLPLDRWRAIIGFTPWHFWGLVDPQKAPVLSGCNTLLYQHTWMSNDRTGRNDIIEAIAQAEKQLFDQLGFWPAPKYSVNQYGFPQYPAPQIHRIGFIGGDGGWATLDLRERHIQAIGVETSAVIDDNATVVYSDLDGDGLNETFTVTVSAGSVTDIKQVKLYFNATDRYTGEAIGPRWEIKPVSVSIAGGNITIKGSAWLLVKPVLYERFPKPPDLQITDVTNFVSSLDVYRVYIDPTGTTVDTAQAKVIYETLPYSSYACCDATGNSTDPAGLAYATARAGIHDGRLGLIAPAQSVYNATSGVWCTPDWPFACRNPDRIEVRYQAGYPLDNFGKMVEPMEKAVAYLAAADMPRNICACDTANRSLYYWQFDLAKTSDGEQYGGVPGSDLDNPFGTRRGHVEAWKKVKTLRILTGFSASAYL